jgi:hypothetical protein
MTQAINLAKPDAGSYTHPTGDPRTGFINEFISPEDVEAYRLREIDKHFIVGGTNARDWTIDRARGTYLRNVANGREEFRSETTWSFLWHENLFTLEMNLVEGSGGRGEPGWSHWRINRVYDGSGVPVGLENRRSEFLDDLKSALVAHGGAGIYSADYSSYEVTLNISEGCALRPIH